MQSQYLDNLHLGPAVHPLPPDDGPAPPIPGPVPVEPDGQPPLFASLPLFDRLTGGFRPGEIALLQGTPEFLIQVAWRLCVRSVADFGWPVALVDGSNLSNVRGLLQVCKELRVHRDLVLPQVQLARAFTAYQMTSLIIRDLPKLVRDPHLILVLGPDFMYADPDMEKAEARALLDHSLQKLQDLTREHQAVTVLVQTTHPSQAMPLAKLVDRISDSHVTLTGSPQNMILDTGSHRIRYRPAPPGQRILDAYGIGGWS